MPTVDDASGVVEHLTRLKVRTSRERAVNFLRAVGEVGGRAGRTSNLLRQLAQPPSKGVEAAQDGVELGVEPQRVFPADGVPGAWGEHGDAAS
jgi:hypothetical protein